MLAATNTSADRFLSLRVDAKVLRRARRLEHLVYQAQLCVRGCADALAVKDDDDSKIDRSGFDSSDVDIAKTASGASGLGIVDHELKGCSVRHNSICLITR